MLRSGYWIFLFNFFSLFPIIFFLWSCGWKRILAAMQSDCVWEASLVPNFHYFSVWKDHRERHGNQMDGQDAIYLMVCLTLCEKVKRTSNSVFHYTFSEIIKKNGVVVVLREYRENFAAFWGHFLTRIHLTTRISIVEMQRLRNPEARRYISKALP